jgi:trk system potassium uptake protein TrkA
MYIVICGGGKIGYYLAKQLIKKNHEVTIIEKDKVRYEELADKLGEDKVIFGDATLPTIQKQAGISRANVAVVTAGADEVNLIISQVAKTISLVPRVISRVNDPENEDLFRKLGVDTTINATKIIFSLIEQTVSVEDIVPLLTFDQGKVNLVEINVNSNSPAVGKRIRELALPKDCILISLLHRGKIIFPRGDTLIQPKDTILALTTPGKQDKLGEIF